MGGGGNEELKLISEGLYFTIALLKFDMWGAEGGGHVQYKNDSNSKREHRAMYVCVKIALCFFL